MSENVSSTVNTYILRDMIEAIEPQSVSFMPQTIGWKVLAVIIVLLGLWCLYKYLKKRWLNRYRDEALKALNSLGTHEINRSAQSLFSILKLTLSYAAKKQSIQAISHNDKRYNINTLIGNEFIDVLNHSVASQKYGNNNAKELFDKQLSQKWQVMLYQPDNNALSAVELSTLITQAKIWVKHHDLSLLDNVIKYHDSVNDKSSINAKAIEVD